MFPRADNVRNPDSLSPGDPACRFRDADGVLRYESAERTFAEKLKATLDSLGDSTAKLAGAVVEKAEGVTQSLGLDKGVLGVVGKLLGVPPWLLLAAGLGIGYLVVRDVLPRVPRASS